ncbi:unnamed protein product [Parascedosporium putredinis]|uniref:Uncharacterized protein n=1 Tax=Parascedosporium putredinis TaxID=1442378 RepID=A0A9P1H9C8_9PEZI|nr:unnamed protein product [Parascedosporium putredinis]CAI8001539.1 unnamed protein product [Parascedosporium putredinis]
MLPTRENGGSEWSDGPMDENECYFSKETVWAIVMRRCGRRRVAKEDVLAGMGVDGFSGSISTTTPNSFSEFNIGRRIHFEDQVDESMEPPRSNEEVGLPILQRILFCGR